MFQIGIFLSFLILISCDYCDVSYSDRIDCAPYLQGVTQQDCEQKDCCWNPVKKSSNQFEDLKGVPWCYYPIRDRNCFVDDTSPGKVPFSDDAISKMRQHFKENINIEGKGGSCASPSKKDPDYYYHWSRDGALSMRAYMNTHPDGFEAYVDDMKEYTEWVNEVHDLPRAFEDIDIRIEVKYNLPSPTPYTKPWCRPQTDGPSLRAGTLIYFAQKLLEKNQSDFVKERLWTSDEDKHHGGAIKYDLDWCAENWAHGGCDLWEEYVVDNSDFFWNRMHFKYSLLLGSDFAKKMGDTSSANKYYNAAIKVNGTLMSHWNGEYVWSSKGKEKDTSVILAFNDAYWDDDQLFNPASPEVAGTIDAFTQLFCQMFNINEVDKENKVPGVLLGRYQGDSFFGGNAWILNTASLGRLYYRGASYSLKYGVKDKKSQQIFGKLFNITNGEENNLTNLEWSVKFQQKGDAILKRIEYHTKGTNYHLSEQLDRKTGFEESANDLTWSYACVLKALKARDDYMNLLHN